MTPICIPAIQTAVNFLEQPFFHALLNIMLPPDLQHLVILSMIASNPTEGREIMVTLTQKYPSLHHLYLHFPDEYWMTWIEFPSCADAPTHNGQQGFQRGFLTSGYLNVHYDWF